MWEKRFLESSRLEGACVCVCAVGYLGPIKIICIGYQNIVVRFLFRVDINKVMLHAKKVTERPIMADDKFM